MITAAIWYAVGFLIFWRRSDDWLALLAAFVLVMFNITIIRQYRLLRWHSAYPLLALPLSLVSFLGQLSLLVFFLLFPNGRLVPRWMGLILLLVIIHEFFKLLSFPHVTFQCKLASVALLLVTSVLYGAIIYSQIYRYRRVSTPVQRQQTKWIILGLAAAIGVVIRHLSHHRLPHPNHRVLK